MKAIDNSSLQRGLTSVVPADNFLAAVNYTVVPGTPKVTFTDASTFNTGDSLKAINVYVADRNGMKKTAQILAGGGSVDVNIAGFDLNVLSLEATVVSVKGSKATIGTQTLFPGITAGALGFADYQPNENTDKG